jgi:molybdopterin converting factor small subunit
MRDPGSRATDDVVTVRYWAGARQAAGTAEERLPAGTLAAVVDAARAGRDEHFAQVLSISSFLVDEIQVSGKDPQSVTVQAGSVVDVLPPFAGG